MTDLRETDPLARRFFKIVRSDPLVWSALLAAREADRAAGLPNWRLVSGLLYNAVWNHLTGRPSGYGTRDLDLAYFDAADRSYEAEDAKIRAAAPFFAALDAPAEVRNQARVHLWFEARFGQPYAPLASVEDGIDRYATRAHMVGLRLEDDDRLDLYAPCGLAEIFALRLRPNRALDNRETHARKAARAQALWPEIAVEPW